MAITTIIEDKISKKIKIDRALIFFSTRLKKIPTIKQGVKAMTNSISGYKSVCSGIVQKGAAIQFGLDLNQFGFGLKNVAAVTSIKTL